MKTLIWRKKFVYKTTRILLDFIGKLCHFVTTPKEIFKKGWMCQGAGAKYESQGPKVRYTKIPNFGEYSSQCLAVIFCFIAFMLVVGDFILKIHPIFLITFYKNYSVVFSNKNWPNKMQWYLLCNSFNNRMVNFCLLNLPLFSSVKISLSISNVKYDIKFAELWNY